ncbi:MAG: SDR family NAD(P)-dependent oxidoreductase [Myxococcota bacterium]
MSFEGREAVVTGGTGALGRGAVARLVAAGATVHVPVFASSELEGFPFVEHPSVVLYEGLDLTVEADVAKLYGSVPGLYASIHLAGGFDMGPIADTRLDTWERLLRLNATTCFLCCREAVRTFGDREGRIVNVAARPALVPTAQMTAYAASKAAVAALTQSLSEELAASGVWVNAVVPSIIDTPANRRAMPAADYDDWPTPEQICETIVFLASPDNAVTRGALVPVYGRS